MPSHRKEEGFRDIENGDQADDQQRDQHEAPLGAANDRRQIVLAVWNVFDRCAGSARSLGKTRNQLTLAQRLM